tara:strand:+ start:21 stop:305 length:285 start_codon:yes stop_codon:yes gene_type:complete
MITKDKFIEICTSIEDPELHIDIWTLGLIYNQKFEEDKVWVKLTFTSPFCPFGDLMISELKEKILKEGVREVDVEVTFDPPWEPSEELREILGV